MIRPDGRLFISITDKFWASNLNLTVFICFRLADAVAYAYTSQELI